MLRLSAFPSDHYYYTRIDPADNQSALTGYYPITSRPIPKVTFVTTSSFGVPLLQTEDIQLGWMVQGSEEWGALHDRGVEHFGIDGSIVCNNDYLQVGFPSDLIVPWGTNSEWRLDAPTPDKYFTESGKLKFADFVEPAITNHVSVTFDGDDALVRFHRTKMSWTVPPDRYVNYYPELYVFRWYHLNRGTGGGITMSPVYWATQMPSLPTVILPNGTYLASGVQSCRASTYGISLTGVPTTNKTASDASAAGTSSLRLAQIKGILNQKGFSSWAWSNFSLNPDPFDRSTLGAEILKDFKYVDASLLLTMFDLCRLRDNVKSWKNLLHAVQIYSKHSTKVTPSNVANLNRHLGKWSLLGSNAFLSEKYGIMPNLSDIHALLKGVFDLNNFMSIPRRTHARRTSTVMGLKNTVITTTSVLTVETAGMTDGALGLANDLVREGKRWGVYPSVSMLADVVPYSFVLSWVTTLPEALKRVQMDNDKEYLPIAHCISSQKRVWTPQLADWWPQYVASGTVQFKYYSREITRELPLPSVSLGVRVGSNIHWAEAAALVVQRVAKLKITFT